MLSVLVRPDRPLAEAHQYTTALGLAARDACERVVNVRPRLKWPNDLVFGNRKLAGMLSESAMQRDEFVGMVLGIGINVLVDGGLPEEVRLRATSLQAESVDTPEIDRVQLAAELVQRFAFWCEASAAELREENLRHSATVGSQVRVDRGDEDALVGRATGIDDDGRLIVEDEEHTVHRLSVGDVTHLRRV